MFGKFSKILVAYDDSELSNQAVEAALKLAATDQQIEIDVVTVMETFTHSYVESNVYYEEILELSRKRVQELMSKLAEEQLGKVPNKTNTVILEGHPAKMIIEFAEKNGTDLIIIGSRGLSGLKEFVLGSVSSKVAQLASCPVLIIK